MCASVSDILTLVSCIHNKFINSYTIIITSETLQKYQYSNHVISLVWANSDDQKSVNHLLTTAEMENILTNNENKHVSGQIQL